MVRGEPCKTAELGFLIDRFGDAIQFDLRYYWQVDLVEYFDGSRRPIELWWFINQLPRNSRYWSARSQDVELYKMAVARSHKARKSPPPEAYEYSSEQEYLGIVAELLNNLNWLVANKDAPKRKRKRYKPLKLPVPQTAATLVRREEARAAHEHLESVVRFVPDDEWMAQQAVSGRGLGEEPVRSE